MSKLSSGVQGANNYAFAALKDDGTVTAWKAPNTAAAPPYMHSVEKLIPGAYSFTAITQDGHALIWGKDSYSYTATSTKGKAIDSASTSGAYAILSDIGKVTVYGRGAIPMKQQSLTAQSPRRSTLASLRLLPMPIHLRSSRTMGLHIHGKF